MLIYSQPLELTKFLAAIDNFLHSNFAPGWAIVVEGILVGAMILVMYALIALVMIYIERKIAAFFQARLGPNRVGKYGIFQSLADMIKILIKEVIHIKKADKFLFFVAPFL